MCRLIDYRDAMRAILQSTGSYFSMIRVLSCAPPCGSIRVGPCGPANTEADGSDGRGSGQSSHPGRYYLTVWSASYKRRGMRGRLAFLCSALLCFALLCSALLRFVNQVKACQLDSPPLFK